MNNRKIFLELIVKYRIAKEIVKEKVKDAIDLSLKETSGNLFK